MDQGTLTTPSWLTIPIFLLFPFALTYTATLCLSALGIRGTAIGEDPPPVPYCTAFVGNALALAFDTLGFLSSVVNDFGNVPVRLALGSEKIYFISGTENLQTIFSKSRDLSTKALALVALVSAHGMPPADAKVYEADNSGIHLKPLPRSSTPPEKRLRFISHHHFQSELLGGAGLGELSRQFIRHFATRISERSQEIGDQWGHLPDLYDFVKSETFVATTIALCGEHIFKINPNLAEDFWSHDSWLPCILRKVPRWVIPKAFASRDKNHENIMKWHKLARELVDCSDEKLKDVLWEPVWGARIMRKRAEMYKHVEEISPAGRAASDLGMIWAANANIIPAAGWCFIHIIADPALTARILEEISPCFSSHLPESVDLDKLSSCPLLQSVVAEVLRLNVAVMINRTSIVPNFKLGKWTVQPDKIILASIYFSHRDKGCWNTGRKLDNGQQEHPLDEFWGERFLEYPNDPYSGPSKKNGMATFSEKLSHKSIVRNDKEAKFTTRGLKGVYIPWGGGANMCPGRCYAKYEMCLVVAMLLWAFEIEFLDIEAARKTKPNMAAFAIGTLAPAGKNPIRLRRRKF